MGLSSDEYDCQATECQIIECQLISTKRFGAYNGITLILMRI